MTQEQEQAAKNKREMRAMCIFSAGVVLLILGMMGANMMWGSHTYTGEPATDISSQSRTAPAR
jgi:flagellar basal body-associated protein FliL